MAAKVQVNFFLEDSAQEAIIPPLFERIFYENIRKKISLRSEVLHARGGCSISAMKSYLADAERLGRADADCIVVGSDSNCKGFVAKRDMLVKDKEAMGLSVPVIVAVPDPHIERWYLLDPKALSIAVGEKLIPHIPPYKCGKDEYKHRLRDAFENSTVAPLSGGIEYGPDIAANMELYKCGKLDHGLAYFIDQAAVWTKSL